LDEPFFHAYPLHDLKHCQTIEWWTPPVQNRTTGGGQCYVIADVGNFGQEDFLWNTMLFKFYHFATSPLFLTFFHKIGPCFKCSPDNSIAFASIRPRWHYRDLKNHKKSENESLKVVENIY
jgi:hypothetical protein